MIYFAYGSNMFGPWLRSRAPRAAPLGVAALPRHRLRWHKRSVDGSAKCDIVAGGDGPGGALGVLYEIDDREKPALDEAEGVSMTLGYVETPVVVRLGGRTVEAVTYVAKPGAIDASLLPYRWYKELVVAGAREHGLPGAYVQDLEARPSRGDPDPSRATRLLAVKLLSGA